MAKTVQLSDEAYERLKMLKHEGESFSDVVNRIASSLKDPRKLLDLPPALPGISWEEIDDRMRAADQARARTLFDDPDRDNRA